MHRPLLPLLFCACFCLAAAPPAATTTTRPKLATTKPAVDPNHELVVRNGKIVDGAGNAWFYGDVLIRGGRIVAVGDRVDASPRAQQINAAGLVVAPGFIDVHTHVERSIYDSPLAENFIRDGVTTIVTGNCGGSVTNVAAYFDGMRARGSAINIATLIGHNSILEAVKGGGAAVLTPAQMDKAKGIVRKAMLDGAVGMSTGLIYRPGTFSSTEEIIELQKVAAEYGGIYATHMRNESGSILDAIDEALRVGREAGCRVEISHFKLPVDIAKKIGGADTTLGKVLAARARGQEVWLDQYPYTASSTSITTLLPDWVYDKGSDEARKRLDDPEQVKKILADMKQQYEVGRKRTSLAYAVVAGYSHDPSIAGMNLYEVAQTFKAREQSAGGKELLADAKATSQKLPDVTMEDQYRTVIELARHGGAQGVFHTMDEKEVEDILANSLVAIASDSGIRSFGRGVPHPRGYGTNTRVLGRYVRERKTITLEDAVRKMTSLPATAFRFADRGLIRVGCRGDLTIFDAETVTDKATFDQPHQYPVGIRYVVVNGYPVLANDRMTGLLPGGPILGPAATVVNKSAADARELGR